MDVGLHDKTTVSLYFRSLYSLLLLLSIFLHGIRASLRSLPSSLLLCLFLFPEVSGCFSVFRHDPIVSEHGGFVVVIVRGDVHSSFGVPCVR